MLNPSKCYNEVCYKRTALHMGPILYPIAYFLSSNQYCLFQKLEKGNNMLLPDSIKVRTREKEVIHHFDLVYSKTCVKQQLKNRQNKDLNDKW